MDNEDFDFCDGNCQFCENYDCPICENEYD